MKRATIVIAIALVAAVAARVAEPAHQRQAHFSAALACGVERWSVKTLKDRPRLLLHRPTTVAYLTGLPRPTVLPATRMPFEPRLYGRRQRDPRPDRGRPRPPPRPARRAADDDRGDSIVSLHQRRHRLSPEADVQCSQRRPALLARASDRCGLLRLPARADWCGSERDRAPPIARLRLPGLSASKPLSTKPPCDERKANFFSLLLPGLGTDTLSGSNADSDSS